MKTFDPTRDIVNQISSINENIVFGGSLFSSSAGEVNIKRTVHWVYVASSGSYYQAVFDANYSASTSTELFGVSYGQSVSSSLYQHTSATFKPIKNRTYRLFAKALLGDEDSRFTIGGVSRDDLVFLTIKRSQFKDEIKKGGLSLISITSGSTGGSGTTVVSSASMNDVAAASAFEQTSRGDVGNLVSGSTTVGKVYYQAGVVALVPELFSNTSSIGNPWSGSLDYEALAVSGNFDGILSAVRTRFMNVSFINQTNLHATFYFCRALNDEFNYSSNPTFVDSSGRIIPTSGTNNLSTRTYMTKVALLGVNGETLAVASLNRPIKKTPNIEYSVKVRLDY